MTKYQCPICNRRACDSNKVLLLAKLSTTNEKQADIFIKCQCCKNTLAVTVKQENLIVEHITTLKKAISQ